MSAPFTELPNPISEYSLMCRGCLADSGEMKNIVEWGLVDEFYKCTDIEVSNLDGLSQLLCVSCEETLTSCMRFRERCQRTDIALKNKLQNEEESAKEAVQQEKEMENTAVCVQHDKKLVFMITAPDMDAKIYLNCPYDCREKFQKKKDLFYHLLKTHQVDKKCYIDLQYYCSHPNCHYHVSKEKKYFTGRKYLNQHYNKVHKSKDIKCEKCNSSFINTANFYKHLETCNVVYSCQICNKYYKVHEQLIVHLMRRHPDVHKQYKESRALKRKLDSNFENKKKQKTEAEKLNEYLCDSPKRSSATQTSKLEDNLKNDVCFWKNDNYETKTDEISTQTVFEDLLSLKSVTSEDDSIFFSETVSLSDIQTQTLPIDFGRSNKETLTEIKYPDFTIKETQTCCCLDSPKLLNMGDGVSKSTETQTADKMIVKSDVLLSCSTETQTYFDGDFDKNSL
ncbi:uncharacterized protein LOC106138083 [Amyelois transitella]|uniref:uncharacterized protein LOC106138083 n=1 Tax=Amyelois transitella TaxID=680683 RepID=UPI0029903596|nr:uncharacterized protein LOC106138083 [Amyelois transitella]